ncbi:hypothetical protein R3P38DRAFT_3385816 [Favolaschia claudopus]|uniref:DUF6699 domain-containing protein n=1 Tax=Favolaschia claudopus TaxID=2862362 RepID=A0AAW0DYH3_9AGAR
MSPHVRFSSKNSFYSPPPPLAPVLPRPLTPPSIPRMPQLEPGVLIPTKSVSHAYRQPPPAPVGRAHNLLGFSTTPLLRTTSPSTPPSSARTLWASPPQATWSPQSTPHNPRSRSAPHTSPWSIVVEASNTRFVSVSDVLNTIYRSLRVNLMRKVKEMYVRRCEKLWSSGSVWEKERREGVSGISPKEGDSGVWHLTIA